MSNGLWGSRFPIGNFLSSRIVFALVNSRLSFQRYKNRLKEAKRCNAVMLLNNQDIKKEVQKWIEKGYDRFNIGGGPKNLEGFVNIDFCTYKNVNRAVIANISDLSFVPADCASHIHSNHVIEHLTGEGLAKQITEYYRILRSDGCLTIRCPNALGAAYGFWFRPILECEREQFIALGFPADEDYGNESDTWMHKDFFGLLHWFYGDVGNIQNEHLSIITPTKLKNVVEKAGFIIKKMTDPEAINIVLVAKKS